MANQMFTGLLQAGVQMGQVPGKTQEARAWFRNTAQRMSQIQDTDLFRSGAKMLVNRISIGSMYMFYYNPKYKATLPFYDVFPVMFPFAKEGKLIKGINLHYLHPVPRARLMDVLYDIASSPKMTDKTKLRLNWQVLKNSAASDLVKPCVKSYLSNHLRSRFLLISPKEWDIAAFLPVEQFEKLNKTAVWANSMKLVRNPS